MKIRSHIRGLRRGSDPASQKNPQVSDRGASAAPEAVQAGRRRSLPMKLIPAALIGGLLLSSCGGESVSQSISEGESLIIPAEEITGTASFYPVNVNGTDMEIIAVRDSAGNIRTAFNTCQICYSSGRGYYVQEGNVLVCQNCHNRFTVDQIELEVGGCNPVPILSGDKTVTEDGVSISYELLEKYRVIFSNWKLAY